MRKRRSSQLKTIHNLAMMRNDTTVFCNKCLKGNISLSVLLHLINSQEYIKLVLESGHFYGKQHCTQCNLCFFRKGNFFVNGAINLAHSMKDLIMQEAIK